MISRKAGIDDLGARLVVVGLGEARHSQKIANMPDTISSKNMNTTVNAFISTANAFDFDATLALFASDAVIDDVSVGDTFVGHAGVRDYLDRFFLGYHTVTRLLEIKPHGKHQALVRVDFTGDFGHEIGMLDTTFNPDGLIVHIDADLE
jgi:hypothetical protein